MAIFRIEKTRDYTVMSNHHFKNRELSLKAKGLLSTVLVEQLRTIDKSRLGEFVGDIASDELALIDKAMTVSLGIKTKRPAVWDVTLCPKCKSDFEFAGRLLVKRGWCEVRETCDYCQVSPGVTYGVF